MIRAALAAVVAILMALPAAAQESEAPVEAPAPEPVEDAFGIAPETTIGALHAAGYDVGEIYTVPATDAAVNRFAFVMEHPDGADRPLYVCRLMVGSGQDDTVQFPLIMTNICARLP